jgi:hypothetical protein
MKNKIAFWVCVILFVCCGYNSLGQLAAVKFIVKIPDDTAARNVFIAGSFNYWHAGDSTYMMQKNSNGTYSILLPLFEGKRYEYKYTSGNWSRVEVSINDSSIKNRVFVASNRAVIKDKVEKWNQPVAKAVSEQQQKLNAMKDSLLKKLQPEFNGLQELLKDYAQNMLDEKASMDQHLALDKKAEEKIGVIYSSITKLLWDVITSLSKDQKEKILALIKQPDEKKDFLNHFLNAFNKVIENK